MNMKDKQTFETQADADILIRLKCWNTIFTLY